MADFITTEVSGGFGHEAELIIADALRSAFSKRDSLIYQQYPIFPRGNNGARKVPDFLILDRELGIVIIEVKGLVAEQVVGVEPHQWTYKNFYESNGSPHGQGERQLRALMSHFDVEPGLVNRVRGTVIVGLPFIHSEDWIGKGFDRLPGNPPIIFQDNLKPASLLNTIIEAAPIIPGTALSGQNFELLKGIISGSKSLRRPAEVNNVTGRAAIIQQARTKIHRLDLEQETAAKQIAPGPQRIRGIAGSGKTVMLCQKAAQMHLKHPEWDIALVFFTRSLYDMIVNSLDAWMRHFTANEQGYSPQNRKLRVLHAWGATNQPGFYREVARANGERALTVKDLPRGLSPTQGYAYVLKNLLEQLESGGKKPQQIFDAILVDEGQDLVFEDRFKHKGAQPFYTLAYQSLRPTQNDQEEGENLRRLVWAYDEAQSLDTLVIPSYREIFGDGADAPKGAGSYKGSILKSTIMKRCYRTPGSILTAAHAIGMGLLRPEGMISGLTTKENWNMLGYEVEGQFYNNRTITIRRPVENSPNEVQNLYGKPVLTFQTYASRQDEINMVVQQIAQDVQQEGLNPNRNILVVVLGNYFESLSLQKEVAWAFQRSGINYFIPSATRENDIEPSYPNNDPNSFWWDRAVTISPIHRAKGNEAEIVYVVGFDYIAQYEADINRRNQVFVALTRSRGWAHLSGVGNYPMFDEMRDVLRSNGTYTFTFQRPPRRDMNELDNNA